MCIDERGIATMELMELLKNDRINKGMTQEEYARILNITRGTLSHLEKGRSPSAETAKKISNYFNRPISELIGHKKIKKLSELETTNMLINSLIKKKEITKEQISDEAKKLIWASLELEIKLKLEMKERI
ncbi:helix-turn-helix transcriptional regulator [Clostridium acetobutylicum]|nr:helix-turn-helix transcriptional regulator [Clostridium acetobutylicum]NYC94292.1 transcriptional regulator with XRE-family HTH domain [Clostridium acetobutylicum]OOL99829.1 HTH-type transcriptional regulator ImmR [Clostridium acetobutylicum]OOM04335.1 HTH-type transcriptional regulator ImmR [Clostridium acetobutylicum]